MFPTAEELAQGVKAYNDLLAELWKARQSEIRVRLREALGNLEMGSDRIAQVGNLRLGFSSSPALRVKVQSTSPHRERITLALPGKGSWSVSFKAMVRLLGDFHHIQVKVKKLRVAVSFDVARTTPIQAELVDVSNVDVGFQIDVDGEPGLLGLLLDLLDGLLRPLFESQARMALSNALPSIDNLRQITDLRLASKAPVIRIENPPLERLESTARQIAQEIHDEYMPWGAVLSTRLAAAEDDAPVVSYAHYQDAAIWTGHYVAGECLRFAVTGDEEAVKHARHGLEGLHLLTRFGVDRGLLSRVAVPLDEPHLEGVDFDMFRRGKENRLFGDEHEGRRYRSIGHITRDQYAGAFLGAGIAALRVPALRDLARELVLEMATYLLSKNFCPAEVRLDPVEDERTSVTYALNPAQVTAILALARKLDPDRFTEAFERQAAAWPVQWFFNWLQTLDPNTSYYKFNLEHGLSLILAQSLKAGEERNRLLLPLRTLRQAMAHHDNAWFNLVELACCGEDPDQLSRPRQDVEREIRQQLTLWIERRRLFVPIDLSRDPDLDLVDYPGSSRGDRPERISRQAIDIPKRPSADFLWQRSPFKLQAVQPTPVEVGVRSPGVDFVLAYWLARDLNVL